MLLSAGFSPCLLEDGLCDCCHTNLSSWSTMQHCFQILRMHWEDTTREISLPWETETWNNRVILKNVDHMKTICLQSWLKLTWPETIFTNRSSWKKQETFLQSLNYINRKKKEWKHSQFETVWSPSSVFPKLLLKNYVQTQCERKTKMQFLTNILLQQENNSFISMLLFFCILLWKLYSHRSS